MTLPLWDSVLFEADERLDKPDAEALSSVVTDSTARAIGAIFGWGGGCLSPPKCTFNLGGSTKYLSLGRFQYYICEPEGAESDPLGVFPEVYKTFRANFLTVDISAAGQIADIDFTAVWAFAQAQLSGDLTVPGMRPILYAQPYLVPSDADARITWTGGSGAPTTQRTRNRVRTRFVFSTDLPEARQGWSPILQILWPDLDAGVSTGNPAVRYFSFLDSPSLQRTTDDYVSPFTYTGTAVPLPATSMTPLVDALQSGSSIPDDGFYPGTGPYRSMGLLQLLQIMRSRSAVMLDPATWAGEITRAAGTGYTLPELVYATSSFVMASMAVKYNGLAVDYEVDAAYKNYGVGVAERTAQGVVTLYLGEALSIGNQVSSIQVTPSAQGSTVPPVRFASAVFNWPASTATVYLFDSAGAPVDGSFFFTMHGTRP